ILATAGSCAVAMQPSLGRRRACARRQSAAPPLKDMNDMKKTVTIVTGLIIGVLTSIEAAAQPWVARHGMTSAQYQSEFDTFTAQGFRPTHVSGYTVAGQPRFAAIWQQKPGGAWVARHNMTSAQ